MNEKKYPIYYLLFRWTEDKEADGDYSDWMINENGRVKNSISTEMMFKDPITLKDVELYSKGYWNKYAIKKKLKKPKDIKIEVTFLGEDTWCLTWFSHYTFNSHLTDDELLNSFSDFVYRKCGDDKILSLGTKHPIYQEAIRDGRHLHCLMGAEDRWRWKGPCRCEYCQKLGIVRIDH